MMRTGVWRRAGCWLLVLALVMTPLEALAAEEDGVSLEETAEIVEAPETAEDEESAESPEEIAEVLEDLNSESYEVTTNDATDIGAFSVTLSLSVSGKELHEAIKQGGVFGFAYWFEDELDENHPNWFEIFPGSEEADQGMKWSSGDVSFTYTGPFPCIPNTTYYYRAFFRNRNSETGDYGLYFYGETKTFKTPEGSPMELKPGVPQSFDLVGGASAVVSPAADTPGFYMISASSVGEALGEFFQWNEEQNSWNPLNPDTPIYVDPQAGQYVRFTLNGSQTESTAVSLSLSHFSMEELTIDTVKTAAQSDETGGEFYFRFTPSTSSRYKISLNNQRKDINYGNTWGSLYVWDPAQKTWVYDSSSFYDSFVRSYSWEEGQPQYLYLTLYSGVTAEITISEFRDSVSGFSVESGGVQSNHDNPFFASVSVNVQAPLNTDYQVNIEYEVNGATGYGNAQWIEKNNSELRTEQLDFAPLPGAVYRYRAFINVMDGFGSTVQETVYEQEWKTVTVPSTEETRLELGIPSSFTSPEVRLLSFTPTENGRYTFSSSGGQMVFWDAASACWNDRYDSVSEKKILSLEVNIPQYIQFRSSYYNSGITVTKFSSAVEIASVTAKEPSRIDNFSASIPITAAVPIDTRFQCGVVYSYTSKSGGNGSGTVNASPLSSSDSETVSRNVSMSVLPNADYTCRIYLQEIDQSWLPLGDPVYSNEITFTTGDFPTTELPVNVAVSVTPKEYSGSEHFRFTPGADGLYQITAEGTGTENAALQIWGTESGGWRYIEVSGSTSVVFSGMSGVTQYFGFQLYQNSEYTLTVRPFTATVTEPSVETGFATEQTRGFAAKIPITAKAPLGSAVRLGIEYEINGRIYQVSARRFFDTTSEELRAFVDFYTLPNRTYTYRAFLTPVDADDNQTGDPVYGEWKTFISDASSAKALTDGELLNVDLNGDQFYSFTPTKTGYYTIEISGSMNYWELADLASDDWERYWENGESMTFSLKAGSTQYFHIRGYEGDTASLKVSSFTPTVTTFSVSLKECIASQLEIQAPVTVEAPIGSHFEYGIEYRLGSTDYSYGDSYSIRSSTSESTGTVFRLPAVPGRTYTCRAFVDDRNSGKSYYSTEITVTVPDSSPSTELKLGQEQVSSGSNRAEFTFVPQKTGNYRFAVTGDSGLLTVLRKDGSWEWIYYNARGIMEMNLTLQEFETVYVIQEEDWFSQYSVIVEYTPLTASRPRNGGPVTAALEAPAAGQYLFAAYDGEGRLLAAQLRTASAAGPLTAVLNAGTTAKAVKAFQTGSGWKPLAPAEKAEVQIIYN